MQLEHRLGYAGCVATQPALPRKRKRTQLRQLLTWHALIAPFLKDKPKKTDSDQCFFFVYSYSHLAYLDYGGALFFRFLSAVPPRSRAQCSPHSDHCWWRETGEKQTTEHLFKHCKRWKSEINVLWTTIGKKLGWKRSSNKKIFELFRNGGDSARTRLGRRWGLVTSEKERRRGGEYLEFLT